MGRQRCMTSIGFYRARKGSRRSYCERAGEALPPSVRGVARSRSPRTGAPAPGGTARKAGGAGADGPARWPGTGRVRGWRPSGRGSPVPGGALRRRAGGGPGSPGSPVSVGGAGSVVAARSRAVSSRPAVTAAPAAGTFRGAGANSRPAVLVAFEVAEVSVALDDFHGAGDDGRVPAPVIVHPPGGLPPGAAGRPDGNRGAVTRGDGAREQGVRGLRSA